jgi:hypothetical protein
MQKNGISGGVENKRKSIRYKVVVIKDNAFFSFYELIC